MCKVFPSSLGPVAMRWFNGLRTNTIDSFEKLTQAFGAHFITCRRVVQPLGSLLSMSMREGETLKAYSDRYWEMFSEVDRAHDDVAMNTFKEGLPTEHGLRKSLTGKPVTSVRQLMDRIDKYRRVEEDQMQGRGKSKAVTQERRRDFRPDRYNNNRPRRDFGGQSGPANSQVVSAVFREPVQRVLEKIKDESFFRVMSVSQCSEEGSSSRPKRARPGTSLVLGFSKEDKRGTIQPHDDALVVTIRIGGYDVKRVMVDDGSAAEVMYPDLFRGLNLKPEDLTTYSSPLVGFEGKSVTPLGMGAQFGASPEEMRCEDLERVNVGDDPEKYFQVGAQLPLLEKEQLVEVRGELEARDTRMQEYLSQVRRIQANFEFFKITHIPRSGNAHADSLATLATSLAQNLPRMIMIEDLGTLTQGTTETLQVNQISSARSWMDPIILFLEKDTLPEDKLEAEKIRREASRFWLSEDKKLYKRSYSGPYLLCVHPEASEDLLEELHEGIYGSHTGGRHAKGSTGVCEEM
nr:hypothetical protein CFP56_35487 [Quercus suber]